MQQDEWTAELYEAEQGTHPVAQFLDSLDKKTRARFRWSIEQLRLRNVQVHEPLATHLEGKIWELWEERQRNIYCIIYVFDTRRRILFLHGFQKRSQKTPRREIEIAASRYRDFLAREQQEHPGGEDMAEKSKTRGQQAYDDDWAKHMADPAFRKIYDEEAAKKELWLQLVEARQAAGLSQAEVAKRLGVAHAQIARIEKRGYDAYTLTSLRRYVQALGNEFSLEVRVHRRPADVSPATPQPVHHA